MTLPPSRDDELLDRVLGAGLGLGAGVVVRDLKGTDVLLRMLGEEGRLDGADRLGTVGVLGAILRCREDPPIELRGVEGTLGRWVGGVLGVELGRLLRMENPPR